MKRSRVVAAGAERAAEMRRLEGDYRALARLRSESAALVSTGSGPGAGRATLSSLAGLTSLWRNASSSRLRLGVSSAECGYSFPVYLAYFFEVLGLQAVDPSLDVLDVLRSGTGPRRTQGAWT